MNASGLETLDFIVVAVYLLGTIVLGLAIGWKFETGRDFFLAGRSLPWWAIGMSLVASDIGAPTSSVSAARRIPSGFRSRISNGLAASRP